MTRVEHPALSRLADHPAKRVGQGGWHEHDRQHAKEVGERRRVGERMRAVGIEEPAAVRAEVLDHLEGGDGTLRDHLGLALEDPRHV